MADEPQPGCPYCTSDEPCVSAELEAAAAWRHFCFLIAQMVRCDVDGDFDPDNPWVERCEGCLYDRMEIAAAAWHYSEAAKAREER